MVDDTFEVLCTMYLIFLLVIYLIFLSCSMFYFIGSW